MAMPSDINGRELDKFVEDASGNTAQRVILDTPVVIPDVEIGAVEIKNATTDDRAVVSTVGADAVSNTQNELEVNSRLYGWNATTWDRIKAAQGGAATTSVTGYLSTIPVLRYTTTPAALTNNQFIVLQGDPTGSLKTIQSGCSSAVISTATTTTVRTGAGVLVGLIVTGGTAGTIIVYDNTAASGTKLADFDSTNAISSFTFNASFATGLTVVTGAATKVTVLYRLS